MSARILLLALLPSITLAAAADSPERLSAEENILRDAGVKPWTATACWRSSAAARSAIRRRKQIGELIRRLGADDFDERENALAALRKIGGRAMPLVRAAMHDSDAEVARRAERFLKEVEPPPPLPAVAAARLLARRGPADAVPVLLDYLPFAGDEAVEDEVRAALAALTPDGKADPALAAALDDPLPVKRAAAAYVLARKGDKGQQAAVRKRLTDADARVRWQAAAGLLAGHDRAAVPALTALLADGPFDTAWRAEEVLRRLAGDKAPAVVAERLAGVAAASARRLGGVVEGEGRRRGCGPLTRSRRGCWASRSGWNTTPAASGNATSTVRFAGRSATWQGRWMRRCCPTGRC